MFGDNQPASTLDYARKLCWPISMCSFLRFGNVRGIGASKTTITGTHIAQREVKQHQMKAVHIIPHVVPGLCPICAYNAYRVQICARDKKIEFHKDPSVEVLPLLWTGEYNGLKDWSISGLDGVFQAPPILMVLEDLPHLI
ncbi:hypothetical protein BGZ80_002991 [Entomortierella chlamydospora]|uniref:Uncharacterized protein n=1 Tax=Entomortierella chlamydospora TaxID=101097 RepID=A0A9P6SWS0_9FUNG|nr:hypothetical protein BGZ80_002991 [Entomortierella chlamydospora]